jgi:hypothetical protein
VDVLYAAYMKVVCDLCGKYSLDLEQVYYSGSCVPRHSEQ